MTPIPHLIAKDSLLPVKDQRMLELVSAHWRGDAALGIKNTRYRLTA
jgi:hypothetical protein